MKDRLHRALCWSCFPLLLGVLTAVPARAQFGSSIRSRQAVRDVFLPPARQHLRALTLARESLDEGEYGESVKLLGMLLTGADQAANGVEADSSQDFFIGPFQEEGTRTSLKAEAYRVLSSMPPRGRQQWRLRYGAAANALLQNALVSGDTEKLADVVRMYFHTEAGYQAAILLGRRHLDQGRPLAAAMVLRRVVQTGWDVEQHEPELSVLLAAGWFQGGRADKAEAALKDLQKRMPGAQVRVGAEELTLPDGEEDLLAWLDTVIDAQREAGGAEASQWAVFRGAADRNARSRGGMPVGGFEWDVPVLHPVNDVRKEEEMVATAHRDFLDRGVAALPSLQPIAVGDFVVMRDNEGLVLGVNFDTGERIWHWPWDLDSIGRPEAASMAGEADEEESSREQKLKQRLWEDLPFGQLSSDGESVYFLASLGYAATGSNSRSGVVVGRGGRQQDSSDGPRSRNQLVALDLEREGLEKWIVGGEAGDEPQLSDAFFLGPPLPLHGKLYAMAEVNGEIRLVVLNADTGRLEWSQQLADVDMFTIDADAARRLAGASPSYADGVLVCPTSAGAVVGVDLATRTLLWGYQYKQNQTLYRFGRALPVSNQEIGERWTDATATIADGRVLVTPLESDHLHCLDLLTGKELWTPLDRDDLLYVAGVFDGKAILVGQNRVTAVGLDDGKPVWPSDVSLGEETPSGRGFLSGRHYFLPTTGKRLLKIDLAAGEVVEQMETDRILGNLICYRDEVISQGVDVLAAYPQEPALRRSVAAALAENPNDVEALRGHAMLLLKDGRRDEAIASLRRALEAEPHDETTRARLVDTMLEAVRKDFAAYQEQAEEIETLIKDHQRRAEYLRLMAGGWQEAGKLEKAFEAHLKLAELAGEIGDTSSSSNLEQVAENLRVRRDRWVRAQLARLLSSAAPEQRKAMNDVIQSRYDAALEGEAVEPMRRFLDHFADHDLADSMRLRLGARLLAREQYLEAEQLLSALLDSADDQTAAAAAARLAQLFEAVERYDLAAHYYTRLADRWGEVVCLEGKTGAQLLEEAQERKGVAEGLELSRWPHGEVEADPDGDRRYPSYRQLHSLDMRQLSGSHTPGVRYEFDGGRNELMVIDGWGREQMEFELENISPDRRFYSSHFTTAHARANGHLLMVSQGSDLYAVSTLRANAGADEALLWSQRLTLSPNGVRLTEKSISNPWGRNHQVPTDNDVLIGSTGPLTAGGAYYVRGRSVVCVDPLTGASIWERNSIEPGADIFGDEELLFVCQPDHDEALVLSAVSGELLGKRPIADLAHRWTTFGRRVLTWSEKDDTLTLSLEDPWAERTLWSQEFDDGAKGWLVGDDEVAVMQPSGELLILSLAEAEPRLTANLEPAELQNVYVLRSAERYFVAVHQSVESGEALDDKIVQPPSIGGPMVLVHGPLYAFDRQTGEQVWDGPAWIGQHGLPLNQPMLPPALVFVRHISPEGSRRSSGIRTGVLAIDKRDGRAIYQDDEIAVQTRSFDIVADPDDKVVRLQLPNKAIILKYTDKPVEDAAPAQIRPDVDDQARGALRGIGNALLRGFEAAQTADAIREKLEDVADDPFGAKPEPVDDVDPFRAPPNADDEE